MSTLRGLHIKVRAKLERVPVRSVRVCRNPECDEVITRRKVVPLCPSCRFMGKTGLLFGAVVAGVLMKVFG